MWVADPQISPDGSRVAFVRVSVDEKKDQYDTSIWLRQHGRQRTAARAAPTNLRDTSPRWSPDGRTLAFVRVVDKDGRTQPPQLYLMPLGGGEAARDHRPAARRGQSGLGARRQDASRSSSATTPEDLAPPAAAKPGESPHKSDIRVITEAVYRANGVGGSGFVDSGSAGADLDRRRPRRRRRRPTPTARSRPASSPPTIRAGRPTVIDPASSPIGGASRTTSPTTATSTRCPRAAASRCGWPASTDRLAPSRSSPDGKRIAFVGTLHGEPERSYSQPDLWVVDRPGGTPRNLTAGYDFDVNGSVGGDQRAPRGQLPADPVWSADGRSILIKVGEQGNANLVRVDAATGQVTPLTKGSQEIVGYTADAAAAQLAVVRSTATVIGDLEVVTAATGVSKKLTGFNDALVRAARR